MSVTESLHRQHLEILKLAGQIEAQLPSLPSGAEAKEVHQILSDLTRVLTVHLALEDKALYPELAKSYSAKARALSQEYMNEMGHLAQAYKEYIGVWSSSQAIQDRAAIFRAQTLQLFGLLKERIDKEEKYLYPLADELWS
ncbi:MAG: hemerythrin domain-containing protein [Proteobacteria bacterium]|nr:hemerythrin domain-containing protein [Pseudomonadota bacterium]